MYRLAVAANPRHARARNNLGQLLEGERKVTEALEPLAREARRLAEAFGQHELAAAIDRDMANLT